MASVEVASTRSASEKSTKPTNFLLQHHHDVLQHEKEKNKYKKYQSGLTALHNLIKITSRNILYHNTTTVSLYLVLLILLYVWTTYEPTMELSPPNNYKRTIFNWTHNGNQLSHQININSHWWLKTILQNWVKSNHLEKYPSLCIPCHKRHWIFQPAMWYLVR